MKRSLFILISLLILSCKNLPVIEQGISVIKPEINPFPEKKYQLTHSIKAELPNGDLLLVIGVTVVDPDERSIHAVMMSVEGLVLFDINYKNNNVNVNRGIPGMQSVDSIEFARSLMEDLKLIYFKPGCGITEAGQLSGKYTERYKCNEETVIDIIEEGRTVKINKYDSSNSIVRVVNIFSINNNGLPELLELTAPGIFGYSLYMKLVNSEQL